MIDQLLAIVKDHADDLIVRNDAVPNTHNDAAIAETAQSILGGLQGAIGNGGLESVLGLIGGKTPVQGNPLVASIASNLTENLGSKFGVSGNAAGQIASAIVPMVLSKLITRTNDPNDSSIDLGSVFGQLTGGASQGTDFGSLLSGLGGAGQSGIGELAERFGKAAQSSQQAGLGGMIGKLFGN